MGAGGEKEGNDKVDHTKKKEGKNTVPHRTHGCSRTDVCMIHYFVKCY